LLELLVNTILDIGYWGFFIYMIVVGTFIPLPTQLILLPAGYLASQGKFDMISIIMVTALGTTIGATINYHLAKYLSQNILSESKIQKIQKFFYKYGKASVFLAPLTFGLGQYISIPAGMAKMNLRWFIPIIFTSNALWNTAMLYLGYMFGLNGSSWINYGLLTIGIVIILIISTFIYKEFKSY
jgi:membrane protein DedA with SNARE-associated domain